MVILMFKNLYDEYLLAKQEKKSSYYKVGLISLIISLAALLIWTTLSILIKVIDNGFVQGTLLIVSILTSFILNPLFILLSSFLLVLQWKICFNKFTLFALISNILLLSSIIVSIFLY